MVIEVAEGMVRYARKICVGLEFWIELSNCPSFSKDPKSENKKWPLPYFQERD